jgi:menaquinone-specific isochorismate synthase
VHDSVPGDELAETGMKFRPIVEAFGAPPPSPPVP